MTVKYGTNYDLSPSVGDYHVLFYVLGKIESSTVCSEISLPGAWKYHFRVTDGFDSVQQWLGCGGAFLLIPLSSPSLPPLFPPSLLSPHLPPFINVCGTCYAPDLVLRAKDMKLDPATQEILVTPSFLSSLHCLLFFCYYREL